MAIYPMLAAACTASESLPSSWLNSPGKRVFDIVSATALQAVFAVPMLVIAGWSAAQKHESVIYKQKRIGRDGQEFTMFKFRTMPDNVPEPHKPIAPNDPRVPPFGRFLRKTHLDELPQLWNILSGEMSLVGPRPLTKKFADPLAGFQEYKDMLGVKPGLSGRIQVDRSRERGLGNKNACQHYLQENMKYLAHASLAEDAAILIKTIGVVVNPPSNNY